MTKLNDTQLVMLSAAARREDRFADLGGGSITATHRKLIAKLINLGFLVEVATDKGQPTWRAEAGGEEYGLQITEAGLIAIGIDPADGSEPEESSAEQSGQIAKIDGSNAPTARAGSKTSIVVDLLRRDSGATLAEITTLTNWLPHSASAALTGLRKKGHQIERFSGTAKGTSYRIIGSTSIASRSDLGDEQ